MRVMFTFFYLTIGFNGLSLSMRSCSQDPKTFTMEEMESIVYAVANDKGVPPTVILNRLLRKVRIKQRTEKMRPKNPLQELALEELINSESLPPSSPMSGGTRRLDHKPIIPKPSLPETSNPDQNSVIGSVYPQQRSSQSFPIDSLPPMPEQQTNNVMTGVFLQQGYSPQLQPGFPAQLPPGFPPQLPPGFPPHLPPGFPAQLPQPVQSSIFMPFPNLSPPPGVTIRVKAGSSTSTIPEVTITLSPMMTIVEALKQAESKFRSVLGLSPVSEDDVISFSHSSFAECYVIRSFDNIETSENGFWKIIVSDISGKVIYDSVCLPSRKEVAVKPGMTITLLYTVV